LAPSTNLLVATGDQGTILTSSDGRKWTQRSSGTTNWLFRVRWLNGAFLAVGEHGTLLESTNGLNWFGVASGTTNWLNDAVLISNTCYAVGNNGTVLASTNLVSWESVGSITSLSLLWGRQPSWTTGVCGPPGNHPPQPGDSRSHADFLCLLRPIRWREFFCRGRKSGPAIHARFEH
jgi:hypothetical protein